MRMMKRDVRMFEIILLGRRNKKGGNKSFNCFLTV
jgi:hypothetical protein